MYLVSVDYSWWKGLIGGKQSFAVPYIVVKILFNISFSELLSHCSLFSQICGAPVTVRLNFWNKRHLLMLCKHSLHVLKEAVVEWWVLSIQIFENCTLYFWNCELEIFFLLFDLPALTCKYEVILIDNILWLLDEQLNFKYSDDHA